ncbi:AGC family protein kinase [Tritrichomonas foetus]|uniref:AGC family protein kinase n=1 Tax=Tritrichomonas foetus TaxID=1144522 RepID=A0A1J4KXY9_9EUKA|nr:AGC family protein kinase [Tritrichomonas foetus]|eukprot:OHT15752.1 AGC family protein kinase [Tritrichomonas foetus]
MSSTSTTAYYKNLHSYPYYASVLSNTTKPTEQDSQWLLDTIQSLCNESNQPNKFYDICGELERRGFIPQEGVCQNVPKMKRTGSPFPQVYSTLGIITESDFGTLLKVQNLIDKQFYALKIIKLTINDIPSIMHEVQCLAHLRSARVVRYFSSWIEEVPNSALLSFYIQTEFVEGQSLANFLRIRRGVSKETLHNIILELAKCLVEIHRAGIIHRDFRPSNVMFRSDGSIVVIGFGISSSLRTKRHRELSPPNVLATHRQTETLTIAPLDMLCISAADTAACVTTRKLGNPTYASPQQLNGRKSTPADDIYSFGIIMFEILAQFQNDSQKTMAIKQLRNSGTLPDHFTLENKEESELILQLTNHNQNLRPSAQQIVQSKLFKRWKEENAEKMESNRT